MSVENEVCLTSEFGDTEEVAEFLRSLGVKDTDTITIIDGDYFDSEPETLQGLAAKAGWSVVNQPETKSVFKDGVFMGEYGWSRWEFFSQAAD